MEEITVARQPFYHEEQSSEGHELANDMQIRMLPKLTTLKAETLTLQSNSSPVLVDVGSAMHYASSTVDSEPFTKTPASTRGLNPWSRFCNVPSSPDANSSDLVEADSWRPSSSNYDASCTSSAQAQLESINYAEYFPYSFHGSDQLEPHRRMWRNSRADAGQLVPGFTILDVAAPALEDPDRGSSTRRQGIVNSIRESECRHDLQLQPAHVQQDEGSVGAAAAPPDDDDRQTPDQIQLALAHRFLFLDQERDCHSELIPPASMLNDLGGMTKCSHGFGVSTSTAATRKCECALSFSTSDAGEIAEDQKLREKITGFGSPGGEINYVSTNATRSYTGKRKRRPECEDIADPDNNQREILDRIDKVTAKSRSKPRLVREPRYAIKTRTNVDIMDDGFRWRKYGQKAVRDSPYPRNYYRCTTPHCPVRKRVERTLEDPGLVLTIYEGKHNHHIDPGTAAVTRQQPANPHQQRSNLPNDFHDLSSNLGHEFRAPTPLWPPSLHGQYHELQVAALQDKFNMLRAYQIFKLQQQQQQEFLSTGFINESTKLGPLANFPSHMSSVTNNLRSSSSYGQAAPQLRIPDLAVSLGNDALYGPTVSGTVQPSLLSESLAYLPFRSASEHQGFQVVPGQELTLRGLGQHTTLDIHNYASEEEDLLENFRLPH